MKAAAVSVLGQAPKYRTFADPVAGDDKAIVQVRAAGQVSLAHVEAAWNRQEKDRR